MSSFNLFSDEESARCFRHLPQPLPPEGYHLPVRFPDFHDAPALVLDVESHDPNLDEKGPGFLRGDAYIVGVGISILDKNLKSDYAEYYPCRHVQGPNIEPSRLFDWLIKNLAFFKGLVIGANVIYDAQAIEHENVFMPFAKFRDVQWAEPLLDEHAYSYSLDTLARKYLSDKKKNTEMVTLYGPDWYKYHREIHPSHERIYNLQDLALPPQILVEQLKCLRKQDLEKLYELESRLTPLLLYMKRRGIRVDIPATEKLRDDMVLRLADKAKQMQAIAGREVNWNAPQQTGKLLQEMGVKVPYTKEKPNRKSKKPFVPQLSVKNEWLKTLDLPFAKLLLEYGQEDKLRSTFVENAILGSHINGRIHANFNPLRRATDEGAESGTVSGRFSSQSPNLQQIPRRTDLGKQIRALFVPDEGATFWDSDFSQIEFRFLVHFAVKAHCTGADVAQKLYQDDPNTDFHDMVDNLTGVGRDPSKTINFGLVFGMGIRKLARSLGLVDADGEPTEKALALMATYHQKVPFAKEIYKLADRRARDKGFIKTILKRRARFDLWEPRAFGEYGIPLSKEAAEQAYGKGNIKRHRTHKALNSLLQGSAADLLKQSMVDIWESGILDDEIISLYITAHDELGGSCDPGEKGLKAFAEIRHMMETALPIEVPILTSGKTGASWREAH